LYRGLRGYGVLSLCRILVLIDYLELFLLKPAGNRINTAQNMMKTKLLQGFKGLHFSVFIVAILTVLALGFSSCTDEEVKPNPDTTNRISEFFSIQNAEVVQGTIPFSANGPSIGEVSLNATVISGGSAYVSINSDNDIQKLYVSVKGSNQYYVISPNVTKSSVFEFVILLSQTLDESFEIQISALLLDGTMTSLYKSTVTYYAVGTGDLQISLSFDNEKDVDLYVIQPDGVIIYYGNKGGQIYDSITGLNTYWWGLDLDSNPACNIDSINNENVFYPDSLIQTGTYQVWVNMYSNCDPSIATNCVVTALAANQFVTTTFGTNPSTVVFPIAEPSNNISNDTVGAVKVMEFTIAGTPTTPKKIYNTKLTQSAKAKIDRASYYIRKR